MIEPANLADAIRAFNEGVQAMQEGDSDRAAARWQAAADRDPGMLPALHNLVVHHEQRGLTEEVIATYDRMLAFDPFHTEALIRQASAYRRAGQIAPAIANYERAISVYPYFRHWYEELATLHDQAGDNTSSAGWREKARGLDTDEAEMAFEDGVRQQRGENFELAVAIFEAVLEDQPGNLDARVRLAECLHALDRTNDAVQELTKPFELNAGAQAAALLHRARFLLRDGNTDAAAADLEAALQLAPSFGRAQRLLRSIRAAAEVPPQPSEAPLSRPAPAQSSVGPQLRMPPEDTPWLERVRFMIHQATELKSRTGKPGRIAVLFESAVEVHPLAVSIMQLIARPELQLVGNGASRVFCIEGESAPEATEHGTLAEGWYGASYFTPEYDAWISNSPGMPIDRMLESAQLAVGSDGFNLLLIVGTGKVREDQTATERYLRAVPTYQTAVITIPGGDTGLTARVASHVPNFIEVVGDSP